MAIPVRHAQDVDLPDTGEVEPCSVGVSCTPLGEEHDGSGFGATLDLPSGIMTVGDADAQEIMTLRPGRWMLQIALDPTAHAETVDVTYRPID